MWHIDKDAIRRFCYFISLVGTCFHISNMYRHRRHKIEVVPIERKIIYNQIDEGAADQNDRTAAICAIVGLDEGAYIDEWLEYHIALGFDTIYLNDNTNNFMFQNWTMSSSKSKGRIQVQHTPASASV